jgi:transcriptional regulator with XRE-family HTH domain
MRVRIMKGNYIKEDRLRLNMTQSDLAEKLDVSVLKISRWEDDSIEPSLDEISKMASIFGEGDNLEENIDNTNQSLELLNEENAIEDSTLDELKVDTPLFEDSLKQSKVIHETCRRCGKTITNKDDLFVIIHSDSDNVKPSIREEYVCRICKFASENKPIVLKSCLKSPYFLVLSIHAIVWPLIHIMIFLGIAFSYFFEGNTALFIFFTLFAVIISTYIGCVISHNNFISKIFYIGIDYIRNAAKKYKPCSRFDFAGCARNERAFRFSGHILLFSFLASLFVGIFTSIFVYPYALIKNLERAF